ncbi:hypothetical protein JYT74_01695 [Crocinitomix catalasitica]|nr:hypothetical protein [Crocinitomix catalasitica]
MFQELLVDSLNGFTLRYVSFFLFQILCAALLAHGLQIVVNKKFKSEVLSKSALIAALIAFLVTIAKSSLNFSVVAAAIILLLMKFKEDDKMAIISRVLIIGIGFGCGAGSIVQTFIGAIILSLILLFTPLKQ